MSEMKTFNGYEIVDSTARATLEELRQQIENGGGGNSSGSGVPYIDFYEIDIANMAGLYLIDSSKNTLSVIRDSSRNITVNLSKWVSNGCVMVRDNKNVVAWGQDNDDIMFYIFSTESYEEGSEITLQPSATMYANGFRDYATIDELDWVKADIQDMKGIYATQAYVQNYVNTAISNIGNGEEVAY